MDATAQEPGRSPESRAYPRLWSEEPDHEVLFGFLLAAGVALGLLVALYGVLWLRWAIGASPAPGIEGLAVFALIHGGAASAEVPPIPALFGLGGSVKIGLPATTLVAELDALLPSVLDRAFQGKL